jgi:TonB-dependent Receptor Plug Domain/TonB dependent receptor
MRNLSKERKCRKMIKGLLISLIMLTVVSFNLEAQVDNSDLDIRSYKIDSVSITAPKGYRSLMKEPYTEPFSLLPVISTVGVRQIQKQGAVNLIDAMTYIPGGLTETRGRQVKQFFSVRGQKYPYPDYALNGIWQKEFDELPYFISASDIEKIEVVRSSAALLTGLSGIEGLINITTREYTSPEATLELEYGSFNSLHTHLSGGNKVGRFAYAAGAGYDRSDGPSGMHSKEAMGTVYTRFNWELSEKFRILGSVYFLNGKRELSIAKPPADERYINMRQNFDPYWSVLSNVKLITRPLKNVSSEFQVFYSYRNPQFNDEVTSVSTNEKDIEYGLNTMHSVALHPSNTLRIGGLYDHWKAPNGKRFYTGKKCNTETFSVVMVDEQRIGPVTLDAGLRWTKTYLIDYAAFNIDGEGAPFRNVTPVHDEWEPATIQGSFGASWHTGRGLSVNFNSAIGQVKPREGTLDIEMEVPGNETRYKLDLGAVKQLGNSGKVILATFAVFQKDAIALSGTTIIDPENGIVRELYLNRDQNQTGIELEVVSPRIFNLIEPFFNISVMKSQVETNGTMARNRENPAVISGGGLFLDKGNFDLNLFCKYVSGFESARFAPKSAGPQPLGDFLAIDLNGGYTFSTKMPLRLYLRVRNLTDKNYSTVVGYPDFGRMVYVGLRLMTGK